MENKYPNSCSVCGRVAGNKTNTRKSNRTKVQKNPHNTLSTNKWAEPWNAVNYQKETDYPRIQEASYRHVSFTAFKTTTTTTKGKTENISIL